MAPAVDLVAEAPALPDIAVRAGRDLQIQIGAVSQHACWPTPRRLCRAHPRRTQPANCPRHGCPSAIPMFETRILEDGRGHVKTGGGKMPELSTGNRTAADGYRLSPADTFSAATHSDMTAPAAERSEERRVGNE